MLSDGGAHCVERARQEHVVIVDADDVTLGEGFVIEDAVAERMAVRTNADLVHLDEHRVGVDARGERRSERFPAHGRDDDTDARHSFGDQSGTTTYE